MTNDYFPNDPRDYLRLELSIRQHRRPQYSLRAFARDLGMSPSALCEFLGGRHGLSLDRVRLVGDKLKLSTEQQDHFWDLVETRFAREERDRLAATLRAERRLKDTQLRLPLERFRLIADWYHFALLEIFSLPEIPTNWSSVAVNMGLTEEELHAGIDRLERLGLLVVDGAGVKRAASSVTVVGGQVPSEAVRLAHQQCLRFHADQVERLSMDDRESLSVSFKMSKSQWAELRQAVRVAVINTVSAFTDEQPVKDQDQVISLTMQMVPLLEEKK